MTLVHIGDLAQSFLLRRQNGLLNARIAPLTEELASGLKSDLTSALNGDFVLLTDTETRLRRLDGYDLSAREARNFTEALQAALEHSQTIASDLSGRLITASQGNLLSGFAVASQSAESDLERIVVLLNGTIAGQGLLGGTATDRPPLLSAGEILDELRLVAAGAGSASDLITAVDTWFFSAGGGFETNGYLGATDDLAPFQISEGESVTLGLRADADALRELLRNTALAALTSDIGFGFDSTTQRALLEEAATGLLSAQGAITTVRGDLGQVEARIAQAESRNAASRTSLEIARNELITADPYDTATRLEALEFQLEALYAVTARLSRLSLVGYL